jgi:hypothetical protein
MRPSVIAETVRGGIPVLFFLLLPLLLLLLLVIKNRSRSRSERTPPVGRARGVERWLENRVTNSKKV